MTKCPISEITPMSFRKLVHLRASFLNDNFYTSKKAIHSALEKWLSICCQNVQVTSYPHSNSNNPINLGLIFHVRNCSVIFGINFSFIMSPYEKHSIDLHETCSLCRNTYLNSPFKCDHFNIAQNRKVR